MNSIKIVVHKPDSITELKTNFTLALAKIIADRLSYNLIDNYTEIVETVYADEISASECNIMKGEKNEYGCDLHEKV